MEIKFFKLAKFMSVVGAIVVGGNAFADNDFGRLFTTPEERRALQVLRYSEPVIEEEVEVAIEEIDIAIEDEVVEPILPDIGGVTLNGIVYRKNGKSTAWVNQSNSYEGGVTTQYLNVDKRNIHTDSVMVTVPQSDLEFDLKVGQTYEPNEEKLVDIVKDKDAIKISSE